MKSVLVTGGLGFIGSHLVDELIKKSYSVTVLDNMSNNKIQYPATELIINDIRTFNTDRKFDYVIHLAAIATINPEFNPELFSVNCYGFENIYRNIKYGNFIYASSAAAINKKNDYGKSKAHNEYIAKNGLGLRFFNVYGERDNGVVGKLLKPNPVIYGGTQTRDFIYVKDVVRTIIENLNKKGIIEVGTGVETSINELSKIIGGNFTRLKGNDFEEQRSVCYNPIRYDYNINQGIIEMIHNEKNN